MFQLFLYFMKLRYVDHNARLWTTEVIVGVKHAEMFRKHFKIKHSTLFFSAFLFRGI